MILQNLARAIREQNYYAVFLEFVIVIAGVVIGFQVTAWNEDRVDRAEEREIIARLRVEFREIVATGEDYIAQKAHHQQVLEQWIIAAEDPEPLDYDRLRVLVLAAFERDYPERALELSEDRPGQIFTAPLGRNRMPEPSIVFQQLVASGELSLIRSNRLRDALSRRDVQRTQSVSQIERNLAAAHFSMGQSFLQAAFQSGTDNPKQTLTEAMTAPDFSPGLRTYAGLQSFNNMWYANVHEETMEVLEILEREGTE